MPTSNQIIWAFKQQFSSGEPGKKLGSLKGLHKSAPKLPFSQDKEYDVIVIGGGTGGITFASEARKLGLSVALFDYVAPSSQGTTWGLGGTCVNVGCIPKKLFHIGTQVKETTHMLEDYGWSPHNTKYEHDWSVLRDNIQNHIKATNFGYKSKMAELQIDYVNAFAQFENDKTVKFKYQDKDFSLKAKNFVIAAGNRPRDYPGIPSLAKYAITSDDLFSLKEDPGKTLVIGGGYIALECAGFLNGLGKEVTMINRSTFLRVMDQDMAFRIVDDMEQSGVKALTETVPVGVEKIGDNLYEVELKTKDKLHKI
jgi:thioredoxin reductase (NADPH)